MIINFNDFLFEKVIHPEYNSTDDIEYIVSYKKYVYFITSEIMENSELLDVFIKEIQIKNEIDNWYDFLDMANESRPDIIILSKSREKNTLDLNLYGNFNIKIDPSISKEFIDTLKSVSKMGYHYLNVYDGTVDNQGNEIESTDSFRIANLIYQFENELKYKKLPKYVYHGTSFKKMTQILKIGLKPTGTNFKHLYSQNKYLYFSSNFYDAYFYAENTAKINKDIPVILKINTEGFDISKIDKDYDFYINYVGKGNKYFNNLHTSPTTLKNLPLKHLSDKYIGSTYSKFSYKGNVFPKWVESFFYKETFDSEEFDHEVTKKDFKDYIEMIYYMKDIYPYDEFVLDWDMYMEYIEENEED